MKKMSYFLFCLNLLFQHKVSLCRSCYPGTDFLNQACSNSEIHLPLAPSVGTSGVDYHAQAINLFICNIYSFTRMNRH